MLPVVRRSLPPCVLRLVFAAKPVLSKCGNLDGCPFFLSFIENGLLLSYFASVPRDRKSAAIKESAKREVATSGHLEVIPSDKTKLL